MIRLFLYLGFGLIFLAAMGFPVRMWVVTQPETPEIELLWMGPVYALLIGLWSLPNLLLGVLEPSKSRREAVLRFIPIICVADLFLASIILQQIRYWRGNKLQMLLNYTPFLIPCIITNVFVFIYIAKKEKLTGVLKSPKMRILPAVTLASFPLLVAGYAFYSWWQATLS
jgi:hypothetical protein